MRLEGFKAEVEVHLPLVVYEVSGSVVVHKGNCRALLTNNEGCFLDQVLEIMAAQSKVGLA